MCKSLYTFNYWYPRIFIQLVFEVFYLTLLAPVSEVWGKVMFSEACVSHSVRGGSLCDVTPCLAAWSHVPSRGSLSLVSCSFHWGISLGVPIQGSLCGRVSVGGSLSRGSLPMGSLSRVVSVQWSLSEGPQNQKSRQYASYPNAFLFYD